MEIYGISFEGKCGVVMLTVLCGTMGITGKKDPDIGDKVPGEHMQVLQVRPKCEVYMRVV